MHKEYKKHCECPLNTHGLGNDSIVKGLKHSIDKRQINVISNLYKRS